jgi:RNA polymerase sigma-70 factor (ECF subfamily)
MPIGAAAGNAPEDLIQRARVGDVEALGRLMDLHRNDLKLLAEAEIGVRLQGKTDSSDVVQDACLAAHQAFVRFKGTTEAEFRKWLERILGHRLLMLVRHYCGTQRRDLRLERRLVDGPDRSSQMFAELAASQSSPSWQAAYQEQVFILADALDRLPDEYRRVIALHDLDGLSFREVAKRMGKPASSTKRLWIRALAELRRSLEGAVR